MKCRQNYAALFALATIIALPLAGPSRSSPVPYSSDQADSGGRIYASQCAQCHGATFRAGPPLSAPRVTVGEIFRYATLHMPMDNALGLTDDEYVRIMAVILRQNGFPAGNIPLTYAAAATSTVAFPVSTRFSGSR